MKRLEALGEAVEIVLEHAERQVLMLLARSLADRPPHVRIALGGERQAGVALADLESELAVEPARDGEIGDDKMEMVERMHAKFAGPACGPHKSLICGHASPPPGASLRLRAAVFFNAAS